MNQKTLKQNIFNRIMVNGNKRTSEKVLFKTLKSIQKNHSKKNFEAIFKTSLVNLKVANFRNAEFGFFGVLKNILVQTPFF